MKVANHTCHPKSLKLTYSSCFLQPSLEIPEFSEIRNMRRNNDNSQSVSLSVILFPTQRNKNLWRVQAPFAASTAFSASWTVLCGLEPLEWRPLWPWAERMLRKRTSLALKKATMNGCLSWGLLPVTRPASWGFFIWPTKGDRKNITSVNLN